jgi:phasin family protein
LQFFVHCTILIVNTAKGHFKATARSGFNHRERGSSRSPKEIIIMTNEDMQKFGKDSMAMAMSSLGTFSKSAQAIAVEVVDYSKKSVEGSAAAWEKLLGAKSLETAMAVQSEYLKSSYEDFVAEATKLGELYVDLAKEANKPIEGALAKVTVVK